MKGGGGTGRLEVVSTAAAVGFIGVVVIGERGKSVNAPGMSTLSPSFSSFSEVVLRTVSAGYRLVAPSSFGQTSIWVPADGVPTTRSKDVAKGLKFGVDGCSRTGTNGVVTSRTVVVAPATAVVPMLRRALYGAGSPGRRTWPGMGSESDAKEKAPAEELATAKVKLSVWGSAEGCGVGKEE